MQEPKQTAGERPTTFIVTVDGTLRDTLKTAAARVKGEIRTYCAEHRLFEREIIVNLQEVKVDDDLTLEKPVLRARALPYLLDCKAQGLRIAGGTA